MYPDIIHQNVWSRSLAYDDLVHRATLCYLVNLPEEDVMDLRCVKYKLIEMTNEFIDCYNYGEEDGTVPSTAKLADRFPDMLPAGERYRKVKTLLLLQIALVVQELFHAVGIIWEGAGEDGNFDIRLYQWDGPNQGIYDTSDALLEQVIRTIHRTITNKGVTEAMDALRAIVDKVPHCDDRDLVAVNNGICDYGNNFLMEFAPEYVFVRKSRVDFVEDAPNPVIHNDADGMDWNVESGMVSLSDNPQVVSLLW